MLSFSILFVAAPLWFITGRYKYARITFPGDKGDLIWTTWHKTETSTKVKSTTADTQK